jgi:hypothetical protein
MKIVYVGLVLLWTMTLAFAATENTSTEPVSKQATHQSEQASFGQVSIPAPSQSDRSAAVLSRAEADSLSARGDSLLAQSGVGEIMVGSVGNSELIYILVVVLLVVLIISVAH